MMVVDCYNFGGFHELTICYHFGVCQLIAYYSVLLLWQNVKKTLRFLTYSRYICRHGLKCMVRVSKA